MSFLKIKKIPLVFKSFSLRINLREMTLVPFLMVFCLVISICVSLPDVGQQGLSYVNFACFIISYLFMMIINFHTPQMTRFGFLHFLFMLILVIATILNNCEVKLAIYLCLYVWQTLMIFRFYKEHTKKIIQFFAIALSFCVYISLLQLITHPTLWMLATEKEGVGYLLGNNYNQIGCRLIIALCTNALCIKYHKIWLVNFILTSAISIASLFMVGSMTSLSMIILFIAFTVIPFSKLRFCGIYCIFIAFILFQVFVVFNGRGLENNDIARYFIEEVLHKDMTFTHRTYLWDAAMNIIPKSPVFGYGLVDGNWFKAHMTSIALGPHNFILAILINGGLLMLILYILICYNAFKSIKLYIHDSSAQILIFSIGCLWIMSLMEMYPYPIMLYPLALAYYYKYTLNKI